MRDPQTLGERLILVRNQHGLTQWRMSQVLGVSRQDVTNYEQGQEVPLPVLIHYCTVFGVRWLWLVNGLGRRDKERASKGQSDGL